MIRLTVFLLAFAVLGFSGRNKKSLDYLFYGLPLNEDTYEIAHAISGNPNFHLNTPIDTPYWHFYFGHISASIDEIRILKSSADSARLDLIPTWRTYRSHTNKTRSFSLKSVELRYYFKSGDLKNAEFDTLDKTLARDYALVGSTSATTDDSTHTIYETYEIGTVYRISKRKEYPQVEVLRNTLDKDGHYIRLIYYDEE